MRQFYVLLYIYILSVACGGVLNEASFNVYII